MDAFFNDENFFRLMAEAMHWLLLQADNYYASLVSILLFVGCLLGMSPLKTDREDQFHHLVIIYIRKVVLWLGIAAIFLPIVLFMLYAYSTIQPIGESWNYYSQWFFAMLSDQATIILAPGAAALILRLFIHRYVFTWISAAMRQLRKTQKTDELSDIRAESHSRQARDFKPETFYSDTEIFIGLSDTNSPITVPVSTWHETNMQVIGPTRYGKGVILGCLMDQIARRHESLFYIDPKRDRFAPHILYQAAKATGRKFYYLALHDEGMGSWAPFAGGPIREGLARIEQAFSLEFTGDPGPDFYKSQERKALEATFNSSRNIEGLKNLMKDMDANRINAELARWAEVKSLCPKPGKGFNIEKALRENAIVYVQGSLDDSVILNATKVFISELIQTARRLDSEREKHLTVIIDEVSFLVSKILVQALATAVGFRVNFVLAYQSQNDLLNLNDTNVSPKYVYNSIGVNSQLKAVYGGADSDTAEWAAKLSGTVIKNVTKMEKSDITAAGGEVWEKHRTIGTQEEYHIPVNTLLSLPPRICMFVQPRKLAQICYTSYITIKDTKLLTEYLNYKRVTPTQMSADPLPSLDGNALSFIEDSNHSESKMEHVPFTGTEGNLTSQNTEMEHVPFSKTEGNLTSQNSRIEHVPLEIIAESKQAKNKRRRERQKLKKLTASGLPTKDSFKTKSTSNDKDLVFQISTDNED